ncbi:MAG: adenylate/guanylate cyclase domain-containing protein [Verrucomicrobia bacterium]|nr:adenylate/guanylate cyclase domain-containing protein [Verrucomicrobiota bacterium]
MRLSTKLFLFIGALLLGICVVVYIVPAYLTEKQLQIDHAEYLDGVKKQRLAQVSHTAELLAEDVGAIAGDIDSTLLLTLSNESLRADLLGEWEGDVWQGALQILMNTQQIDYLQMVTDEKATAVIRLSNAQLYDAQPFPINDSLAWMLVASEEKGKYDVCFAVLLPPFEKRSLASEDTLYLLFDPIEIFHHAGKYAPLLEANKEKILEINFFSFPDAGRVAVELMERLVGAAQFFKETFGDDEAHLRSYVDELVREKIEIMSQPTEGQLVADIGSHVEGSLDNTDTTPPATSVPEGEAQVFWWTLNRTIRRANDLELIAIIQLMDSIGRVSSAPFPMTVPYGSARLAIAGGGGEALLSKDVFDDRILFDADRLLKEHPPLHKRVPLSSSFGLLSSGTAVPETVVNSLIIQGQEKGKKGTLTLGISFYLLMSRIAEQVNETTVLLVDGQLRDYVDRPDMVLTQAMIDDLDKQGKTLQGVLGFITLDGKQYYYSRYQIKEDWDLYFLTLQPAELVLDPIRAFESKSQEMASQLTWHIMVATLVVFLLALLMLELIARQMTKPIRTLAAATQKVAEGKYGEVKLPPIDEGSRNEISILAHSFKQMVDGLQDREKIRSVLDKVVSREIADEILEGKVHLGGEVKDVTVLFADIRNFTSLTENLPPGEVITFVNSYMTQMTEVVERHQGVIDKYIGDEIMALYGAPVTHPYSALQAVLSALIIQKNLSDWNEERKMQGLLTADVGIGIHTGPVVVGNMGAENRLNYTVLGKNVNLSARLADEAPGREIWVSEEVISDEHVAEAVKYEEHSAVSLKGITKPVKVFRIVGLRQGFLLGALSEQVRGRISQVEG